MIKSMKVNETDYLVVNTDNLKYRDVAAMLVPSNNGYLILWGGDCIGFEPTLKAAKVTAGHFLGLDDTPERNEFMNYMNISMKIHS